DRVRGHRIDRRADDDPGHAADRSVSAGRAERLARYRAARDRIAPRVSLNAFKALVAEALDELPAFVRERLGNVAVLVEDWPPHGPDEDLLGLYEGINRVERASGYHLAVPDRITLFWRPIL